MSGPKLARGRTGRRYVWPPNTDQPELVVPSVTTITGQAAKPALMPWAAKMVAEYAVENLPAWEALPPDDAVSLLKGQPNRYTRKRGQVGTDVHEVLEEWLRSSDKEPATIANLDLLPYVAGGVAFVQEHVREVLHIEATIFNRTYQYAGTADLIAELNTGEVAILDWKTSKNVYPNDALQVVAYANGEFIGRDDGTHEPLPTVDAAYIIHLPGDATYKAHKVQLTERAFTTFVALRSLQKWEDDHAADAYGPTLKGPAPKDSPNGE